MCALSIFKPPLCPGNFKSKALVPFTHTSHEVSPQFEKVSWTTLDFKVKMQSFTVLCGDFWSWVGVHMITKPFEHIKQSKYTQCLSSIPLYLELQWVWDSP